MTGVLHSLCLTALSPPSTSSNSHVGRYNCRADQPLCPTMWSHWVTTAEEMGAFLGFVMATSIHRVPRLNNIWSSDWVLGVPALAPVFTRKRFWQLWCNLHLADNTQAPDRNDPSFDRLYKLRPMLNMLSDAFRTAHQPSQQISVNEAMVRFKGRRSLKQYMPKKSGGSRSGA